MIDITIGYFLGPLNVIHGTYLAILSVLEEMGDEGGSDRLGKSDLSGRRFSPKATMIGSLSGKPIENETTET